MKQGWEIKKLGEVCILSAGGDVPKDSFSYIKTDDYQIPIYANGEKNEGFYGFTNKAKVTKPSITVSARGTIGYAVKRLEPFFPIVRLIVVTPINLKELGLDYLDYVLRKIDFKHSGSSIPQLTVPMIKDYEIPIPPLSEQQRIVSILDTAFEAIEKAKANAEQNLKNSKELFDSYLQNIFSSKGSALSLSKGEGWEEKTLGEVCEFSQGIQRDVKFQSEYQKENQIRFLRIIDFTQGNEPPRYIDNPGDKYILNSNDVSLVRYGASTGFVCRGLKGALANNLFRVIPKSNEEIINDFLFIYLTAPVFQNVIKKSMNGAAMPAISFGLIKDISFPIISIEEQKNIVEKFETFSKESKRLEAIYQQKLIDLEELKKSLLEKAFKGELKTNKIEVV